MNTAWLSLSECSGVWFLVVQCQKFFVPIKVGFKGAFYPPATMLSLKDSKFPCRLAPTSQCLNEQYLGMV